MDRGKIFFKRAAPAEILPINTGGMVIHSYEQESPAGLKVFLIARRAKDEKIVWKTLLYSVTYKHPLETDVQRVFLKSLTLEKETLTATDEKGRQYTVDVKTGRKH